MIKGESLVTTPYLIARNISKKLAKRSVVARVTYKQRYSNYFGKVIDCDEEHVENQEEKAELIDLNTCLEGDCSLELLDFETKEGKETFWHSSAHVLGRSLEQLYGGFLTHGPPLSEGFFYDSFIGEIKLNKDNYENIVKKS